MSSSPSLISTPKTIPKKNKNKKQTTTTLVTPQNQIEQELIKQSNANTTISGISKNNIWIRFASAAIGILVYVLIPYISNISGKPYTGAVLNMVPNGIILGFFILESDFDAYFRGLVFVPLFNVIVNIITYGLYKYYNISPQLALSLNVGAWIVVVIITLFI